MLLILHADHGQNCSASAVRLVGSGHANIFSSVAAGIHALSGPLHGGANQAVSRDAPNHRTKAATTSTRPVKRAKDKEDPFRLMGFGHRVYKNFDPRAQIIKKRCRRCPQCPWCGVIPMLDLARQLEQVPSPTTTSLSASSIRTWTSTPGSSTGRWDSPLICSQCLFALGRLPGWIAQWRELASRPRVPRSSDPRQLYAGPAIRDYVPLSPTAQTSGSTDRIWSVSAHLRSNRCDWVLKYRVSQPISPLTASMTTKCSLVRGLNRGIEDYRPPAVVTAIRENVPQPKRAQPGKSRRGCGRPSWPRSHQRQAATRTRTAKSRARQSRRPPANPRRLRSVQQDQTPRTPNQPDDDGRVTGIGTPRKRWSRGPPRWRSRRRDLDRYEFRRDLRDSSRYLSRGVRANSVSRSMALRKAQLPWCHDPRHTSADRQLNSRHRRHRPRSQLDVSGLAHVGSCPRPSQFERSTSTRRSASSKPALHVCCVVRRDGRQPE